MPDEDIFDFMNKRFKKMFKEWSLFGQDFDDMFKDMDETFEIRAPKSISKKDGKTKSYSISYKYQTGMKEPEVHVSGDVSEDEVNRFLSGIQKRFGNHLLGLSDGKPKMLGLDSGENHTNDGYKTPFMEIIEEENHIEIVLEMPGIGESDLTIDKNGKSIIISGENGDIKYKREVKLDFEPKEKIIARENHGIITITIKK